MKIDNVEFKILRLAESLPSMSIISMEIQLTLLYIADSLSMLRTRRDYVS